MSIITIFGLAGTGKSTCGKLLADKLGFEFISTGNIFRKCAEDRGLSLYEYEKLVQENPQMDVEFDEAIRKLGTEKENAVIESRLAWYFVPHSIKFKFICDDSVRVGRIAQRDNIKIEDAQTKTVFREKLHKERYARIYGIEDYTADEHFDFVIDTTKISPEEIVGLICKKAEML